ncbi:hypothetical protein SARC_05166 [Sphaeroforma arctica JP610]|uniref:Uncharacterized protein n=1 Tax=Sphaeroforma arctica JP610 TaxID=667725 RepID=A0A0L0G2Y5_9EUKA|nr:hypothetical protein SARC_05166 [Sphaeroforma arctica JP610]KNC82553.1 hypothetical protein SARC_05166 [Sphaeroforma arctica JP610]|eukprot:XP_014156455.1 hypothetical protein SARC_05166 [Sphaeroforma arctica JP610]
MFRIKPDMTYARNHHSSHTMSVTPELSLHNCSDNRYTNKYWNDNKESVNKGKVTNALRAGETGTVVSENNLKGLTEAQQIELAIQLSEKEEKSRQARYGGGSQVATQSFNTPAVSNTNTNTSSASGFDANNPFNDNGGTSSNANATAGMSVYDRQKALEESIGEAGIQKMIAKEQDLSELEQCFKGDGNKRSMRQHGFKDLHTLWGAGDCAVLVCLCIRMLLNNQLAFKDVTATFGHKAVNVSAERRSLLQYLYDNAVSVPKLKEPLLMEAQCQFADSYNMNPVELIQKHITKMSNEGVYLGITEMGAGPYRDNYVLVFVREKPAGLGGGLDVSGLVAPPNATKVFYTLFHDSGHFDLLEANPGQPGDSSIFAGAPAALRSDLETLLQSFRDQSRRPSAANQLSQTPSQGQIQSQTLSNPSSISSHKEELRKASLVGSGKPDDLWNAHAGLFQSSAASTPSQPLNSMPASSHSPQQQMPSQSNNAYGAPPQSQSGNMLVPEGAQPSYNADAEREMKLKRLQNQLQGMSLSGQNRYGNSMGGMQQQPIGGGYGGMGMGMGMQPHRMGMQQPQMGMGVQQPYMGMPPQQQLVIGSGGMQQQGGYNQMGGGQQQQMYGQQQQGQGYQQQVGKNPFY